MPVLNDVNTALALACMALGAFVAVSALVELKTGRPVKPLRLIRRARRRQASRAATLSMLCFGLESFTIGLTNVTGWNSPYPWVMLFVTAPILFVLVGLAIFFATKASATKPPARASPRA